MAETNIIVLPVTINSGEAVSHSADLSAFALNKDNFRLFGIVMPSVWTAANLTFQASFDSGLTWYDIYDADTTTGGTNYEVAASASRYIPIDPTPFSATPMIKVRSGTVATPVNQAADRILALILRSY